MPGIPDYLSAAYVGGKIGGDKGLVQGGAIGVVVTLLFLVGGAFALSLPLVAVISFVFAALMALAAYIPGFTDMAYWAIASGALATMSFFGFREKRRAATRARDAR